jgi:hypothetical protein
MTCALGVSLFLENQTGLRRRCGLRAVYTADEYRKPLILLHWPHVKINNNALDIYRAFVSELRGI